VREFSGGDNRAELLFHQAFGSIDPQKDFSEFTGLLTRLGSGERLKAISAVVATNSGLLTRTIFIKGLEAKALA
jgi:hypothetical protein